MRILLTGYYGKANFGDDVLLKVTYGLVRKWRPEADVSILCDQYIDDYVSKLINEEVSIIVPGDKGHYDVIIHGGGGTFFDFGNYGILNHIINQLIKTIGFKKYVTLDRFVRKLFNKQRLSADKRLGWGIGVGAYTSSSVKLRQNLPILLDFDALIVRDSLSIENLQSLNIDNAILGSDLAFLENLWVPSSINKDKKLHNKQRLGIVLRDWMIGSSTNYLELLAKMFPSLNERYEMSIFVFDKRVDKQLLEIAQKYKTYIWDPLEIGFDKYCKVLAQQDVLVSSRAHGAMCGAVLGVPTVLIDIEPKLRTIHEMLPNSTVLIDSKRLILENLIEKIEEMLRCERAAIVIDVARNKTLIQEAVKLTLVNNE